VALSGVIFDFDGVLSDSEPLHLRAFQDVLKTEGITLATTDYYERYLGFDDVAVFRNLTADLGLEMSDERLAKLIQLKHKHLNELLNQGGRLFPGAAECILRTATEFPIAIASGAQSHEIETLLDSANLRHHFRAVIASGDTPRSKPFPDPYLKAVDLLRAFAKKSGHDHDGCFVAVEDSKWGIESAISAGLRCIGIAQTYPPSELASANLVVQTIADVTLETLHHVCETP